MAGTVSVETTEWWDEGEKVTPVGEQPLWYPEAEPPAVKPAAISGWAVLAGAALIVGLMAWDSNRKQ